MRDGDPYMSWELHASHTISEDRRHSCWLRLIQSECHPQLAHLTVASSRYHVEDTTGQSNSCMRLLTAAAPNKKHDRDALPRDVH